MFPLDNLTIAFMASFSRYISTFGEVGGPERTEMFVLALLELILW